ncbi:MAG: glyceraldehyde 3-phosphate dehydrogenase NAD-binding domain-containing protein [Candidatus Babeliales bacterium]
MIKISINGFGRIGKSFLRTIMVDPIALQKIKIVAINIGPGTLKNVALLFKYDTIMGQYSGTVEQKENILIVDGHEIEIIQELDPLQINWKKYDIDWIVECTGQFTKREEAQKHLKSGAKSVLISAPAHDEDVSIIPGVNDHAYDSQKHRIISLGSCTTNAFLPMLKVLHADCGLENGYMTTAHAYTNSQVLLDVDEKDPRRSRAAALNIVPTTTGAAKMVGKIIPELKGKVDACAIRVPVGIVSYLTISFNFNKELSAESINDCFTNAATTNLKGILDITMEPLVSSDFIGSNYSVIIDGLMTQVVGNIASVSGWYDNEWAYSMRMKDFLLSIV